MVNDFRRFSKNEIERLVWCLEIPEKVSADNKIYEPDGVALCMLLARLAWPHRLADMHLEFDWKPERVSRITNTLLRWIYDHWHHLLGFDSERLTPERLAMYSMAIKEKNAPLESCWGFVDGTLRPIARPIYGQEAVYNGWKRFHCFKYQGIIAPDGIITHLYGPVEGRIHDSTVWMESGMSEILDTYAYAPNGAPLQIYGDQAYGISDHLISPFAGAAVTQEQREWNKAMSQVRIVVEWCFKEVLQLFSALDFTRTQRCLLSPIGLQYPVAVLLYNAHVCLHHPQITQYFEREHELNLAGQEDIPELCKPPTLEEYFHYEDDD